MADFVFNIAKGKVRYYAELPGTNDALIVVPIETTGIESDAVLKDYDTLAAILAAANNEQTTMGRKTVTTGVTNTVDDTNDWLDTDMDDLTWAGASGNPISALIVCYDPDTTAGTDSDLIPLTKHDFPVSPAGSDVTATIATGGWYRAA